MPLNDCTQTLWRCADDLAQLPTLQDLLCFCDAELLLRFVFRLFISSEKGGGLDFPFPEVRRALLPEYETLCVLDSAGDASFVEALIPERVFLADERAGALFVRPALSLASGDSLRLARDALNACGGAAATPSQVKRARKRLESAGLSAVFDGISLEALSRGDALSRRVWLPSSCSFSDRYAVLAAAFWVLARDCVDWSSAFTQTVFGKAAASREPSCSGEAFPAGSCAPSAPTKEAWSAFYGLSISDELVSRCERGLGRVATVLTHNARRDRCKLQAELARRMEVLK